MGHEDETRPPKFLKVMSVGGVVMFFALCAAYDFWRGYRHDGSLTGGIAFVVLGIPSTLLIWYLASRRSDK